MSYRARPQQNYGSKIVTGADQKVQLLNQLYSSRIVAFDALTLEQLQQRYSKMNKREVECLFVVAVQNRSTEDRSR